MGSVMFESQVTTALASATPLGVVLITMIVVVLCAAALAAYLIIRRRRSYAQRLMSSFIPMLNSSRPLVDKEFDRARRYDYPLPVSFRLLLQGFALLAAHRSW